MASCRRCLDASVVLVVSLLVSNVARGQTVTGEPLCTSVAGLICSDTTWTASASPYCATSSIIIGCGSTLTIHAGVVVQFSPGPVGLLVGGSFGPGTLVARGAPTSEIVFTSLAQQRKPGDWLGIVFMDAAADAVFDAGGAYLHGSVLQHVEIAFAGAKGSYGAVVTNQSSPYLCRSRIHHNGNRGVMAGSTTPMRIEECHVSYNIEPPEQNLGGGIYIYGNEHIVRGNTIVGNQATRGDLPPIHVPVAVRVDRASPCRAGGGIYFGTGYKNTLLRNLIAWNRAQGIDGGVGGGLFIGSNDFTMRENVVLRNSAFDQGGAIWLSCSSNCVILNSIIAGNASGRFDPNDVGCPLGAGGLYYLGSGLVLQDSDHTGNVLFANSAYDILNDNSILWGSNYDVDASTTWWGMTDAAAIQARICDFFDDPLRSVVFPNPWANTGPFDLNGDGKILGSDLPGFVDCLIGPGQPIEKPCTIGDLDRDNDVDLFDFAAFQTVAYADSEP